MKLSSHLFSIKSQGKYKIVRILGIRIKIRSRYLALKEKLNSKACQIQQLSNKLNTLHRELNDLRRKETYRFQRYASPDKYPLILKDWFLDRTGEILNLDNPRTFNEKIQWMKLYDSTPIKTRLADKYLVREWVAEKIGDKYLIPLLGVWDSFDDIDFDALPDRYALKCNHGCAYNLIVKNKNELDKAKARQVFNRWMSEDFAYKAGLELHYSGIPRKIIAEAYIENTGTHEGDLYDYKFWCFNGKVKYIQFLSERNTRGLKMAFYDLNWKKQDFAYSVPLDTKDVEKPGNLDEMIALAEKLAEGFNHV